MKAPNTYRTYTLVFLFSFFSYAFLTAQVGINNTEPEGIFICISKIKYAIVALVVQKIEDAFRFIFLVWNEQSCYAMSRCSWKRRIQMRAYIQPFKIRFVDIWKSGYLSQCRRACFRPNKLAVETGSFTGVAEGILAKIERAVCM